MRAGASCQSNYDQAAAYVRSPARYIDDNASRVHRSISMLASHLYGPADALRSGLRGTVSPCLHRPRDLGEVT